MTGDPGVQTSENKVYYDAQYYKQTKNDKNTKL